jgi:hypothetical protein
MLVTEAMSFTKEKDLICKVAKHEVGRPESSSIYLLKDRV